MAAGKSPGVIFSMEFFQPDKYMVGNHDFLDYMQRPQAFDPAKHVDDEFKDFYDYMKNEEKSDGIFDLKNNLLSQEQISEYRQLEMNSKTQGCPKYVGVISFTNEFLEECGALSPRGVDINRLKSVARSGMSEMIQHPKSSRTIMFIGLLLYTLTPITYISILTSSNTRSDTDQRICLRLRHLIS